MRLGLAITGVLLTGAGPARADEAIRADYLCKGRFDATPVRAFFFNQRPREVVLVVGESATWQLGKAPAYQCHISTPAR